MMLDPEQAAAIADKSGLTTREREVWLLWTAGWTLVDIALNLRIKVRSAQVMQARIRNRLRLRDSGLPAASRGRFEIFEGPEPAPITEEAYALKEAVENIRFGSPPTALDPVVGNRDTVRAKVLTVDDYAQVIHAANIRRTGNA